MKMCKLKNGAIMPEILVKAIMMKIQDLAEDTENFNARLSISNLGRKSHDPSYKIFKFHEDILKDIGLLNNKGEMPTEVKNIVDSAIRFNCDFFECTSNELI